MFEKIYILRHTVPISGFWESFMGGAFLMKGLPLIFQLITLTLFVFLLFSSCQPSTAQTSHRRNAWNLIASLFLFALFCIFLVQPWDEFFIYLQHSENLAKWGTFSFSRKEPIEGIVDFLPFFLLGIWGRFGVPIEEGAIFQSFLGGLLCVAWGLRTLEKWGWKSRTPLSALALITYSPLVFNASNGFSATLFTACILWSIYFIFFEERKFVGYTLLSLIPLIRIEGALMVVLLLGVRCLEKKKALRSWPQTLLVLFAVLAPFFCLMFWRYRVFGFLIPTPVLFKSTLGSLFFLLVGARNLLADLISGLGLIALMLIWAIHRELEIFAGPNGRTIARIIIAVLIFSVPYYLSGGDWFPSYWGRYLFPLLFLLYVFAIHTVYLAWSSQHRLRYYPVFAAMLIGVLFHIAWPIASHHKMFESIFTNRKILAKIFDKKFGRAHFRTEYLSQLGEHLRNTTPESWRIATSEIATVSYYSKRETLDLLGVVNRTIAKAPLRPPPRLIRRFPVESELPFLIFKRLAPNLIETEKPELVFTFDFILRDLFEDPPHQELRDSDIHRGLKRWEYNLKGLLEPLYGGVKHLEELGYQEFVVWYPNNFCTLYFVRGDLVREHLSRLKKHGLTGGPITFAEKG